MKLVQDETSTVPDPSSFLRSPQFPTKPPFAPELTEVRGSGFRLKMFWGKASGSGSFPGTSPKNLEFGSYLRP